MSGRGDSIDARVEARLTELLSSGGVDEGRVAIEILYMLPKDFRDIYAEVFHEALGGAASGASTGAGDGARANTGNKRFKKYWVVKNETALKIKGRADKRLRQMAREMRRQLDDNRMASGGREREGRRGGGGSEGGPGREMVAGTRRACSLCRRFTDIDWRFCPTCGHNLDG